MVTPGWFGAHRTRGGENGGVPDRSFPERMPEISLVAAALGDPSRAAMCTALMTDRAWTVGELARYAGLARSTASEHVDVLVARGIATEKRQGRHRYIALAGEHVARVIEDLGVVSGTLLPTPRSLRASSDETRFREGRTCYRHLAGRLGVRLADQLRGQDLIDAAWRPTKPGHDLLNSWETGLGSLAANSCMDATERRLHLAGPLGTRLCGLFLERGWITRVGTTRAVRLTERGEAEFTGFGIDLTS